MTQCNLKYPQVPSKRVSGKSIPPARVLFTLGKNPAILAVRFRSYPTSKNSHTPLILVGNVWVNNLIDNLYAVNKKQRLSPHPYRWLLAFHHLFLQESMAQ